MVQCVMCPEGKCSENCPTYDVLPYEGPLKEENIRKGRKLQATGMDVDEIKRRLKAAGSVGAKNELIKKWMDEYDAKEKDPLVDIILNRALIMQKQKIIDEQNKKLADSKRLLDTLKALNASFAADYGVPAPAPVAADDDEGLPGLKKCTSNN